MSQNCCQHNCAFLSRERKRNRQSFVTTQRGRTCLKFLNLAGIESLILGECLGSSEIHEYLGHLEGWDEGSLNKSLYLSHSHIENCRGVNWRTLCFSGFFNWRRSLLSHHRQHREGAKVTTELLERNPPL